MPSLRKSPCAPELHSKNESISGFLLGYAVKRGGKSGDARTVSPWAGSCTQRERPDNGIAYARVGHGGSCPGRVLGTGVPMCQHELRSRLNCAQLGISFRGTPSLPEGDALGFNIASIAASDSRASSTGSPRKGLVVACLETPHGAERRAAVCGLERLLTVSLVQQSLCTWNEP